MNTSVCIIAFCSMVVQAEFGKQVRSRQSVCTDVVKEALSQGVDPVLTAAVSFRESAFKRRAVSQAGAVGPMQVLPRFWCKKKNCDYIEAGVRALSSTLRNMVNSLDCAHTFQASLACAPLGLPAGIVPVSS